MLKPVEWYFLPFDCFTRPKYVTPIGRIQLQKFDDVFFSEGRGQRCSDCAIISTQPIWLALKVSQAWSIAGGMYLRTIVHLGGMSPQSNANETHGSVGSVLASSSNTIV